MTYKYDVFLSYRRANAWPKFVDDIFLPMFRHWLSAELGRNPEVFFDADCIETGMQWPNELAMGVASSRLMVCLWSREYFSSDWCMAELSHMMARRTACDPVNPPPLVLAVIIHDGEQLPVELSGIQQFPIQAYSNPWMRQDSQRAEELSEKLIKLAMHVARALDQIPDYDASWQVLATEQFIQLFHRKVPQTTPPSLGGLPE